MACSVYVYYRLREASEAQAARAAAALIARVAALTGVRGRLLVKQGEPLLWMEVYQDTPPAADFTGILAAEASRLDFDSLLQPGRQRVIECFVERPCA